MRAAWQDLVSARTCPHPGGRTPTRARDRRSTGHWRCSVIGRVWPRPRRCTTCQAAALLTSPTKRSGTRRRWTTASWRGCCVNPGCVRAGGDDLGMSQKFIAVDREQELLLPPSLREWLPMGHFAWFVLDAVEQMDLSGFCAGSRKTWRSSAGRSSARPSSGRPGSPPTASAWVGARTPTRRPQRRPVARSTHQILTRGG